MPFGAGFKRLLIFLSLLATFVASSSRGLAEDGERADQRALAAAEQEVRNYVENYAAEAAAEVREVMAGAGEAPNTSDLRPPSLPADAKLDDEVRRAIQSVLSANASPLNAELAQFEQAQRVRLDEVTGQWAAVRRRLHQSRPALEEARYELAQQRHWTTRAGFRDPLLWPLGLLAIIALAGCWAFERRHSLRRFRYGARSRFGMSRAASLVFVLVLALGGAAAAFNEKLSEAFSISPAASQEDDASSHPVSPPAAESGSPGAAGASAAWASPEWDDLRGRLEKSLVHMMAAQASAKMLEEDASRLAARAEQAAQIQIDLDRERRLNRMTAIGIGFGVVGLVFTGSLLLWRDASRRRRRDAQTCPLCLSEGTLEVEPSPDGRRTQFKKLICRNVISDDPPEDCNFSFYSYYQPMTKLCFPALGHPRAGKTHWLAMMYRELNRGNFAEQIEFESVTSETSEDFDRVVDEILESRIHPERTNPAFIPRPLLFNFRDHDRLGASSVLLTMFDYSGEVVASMTLDDSQRRRALEADGYIFFLDPTEFSEPQAKELVRFREDVRIVKQIRAGARVNAPVALCVSKIDLLNNEPRPNLDQARIDRFYEELEAIDPTGDKVSLDVIRARSRLTASMCKTLWPGWQVERNIRSLFGGRYMFFPLTPVGLAEPGETDLSQRTIEPYGILEPLLWLLHMNGHPVLD